MLLLILYMTAPLSLLGYLLLAVNPTSPDWRITRPLEDRAFFMFCCGWQKRAYICRERRSIDRLLSGMKSLRWLNSFTLASRRKVERSESGSYFSSFFY